MTRQLQESTAELEAQKISNSEWRSAVEVSDNSVVFLLVLSNKNYHNSFFSHKSQMRAQFRAQFETIKRDMVAKVENYTSVLVARFVCFFILK